VDYKKSTDQAVLLGRGFKPKSLIIPDPQGERLLISRFI